MKSYANWQCPLYKDETRKSKYFDIPLYGRFDTVSPISVNGLWEVEYLSKGKLYTGFIEDRFMEWYLQNMPNNIVDLSPIQTIEPYDGEQYVIWDGKKQYNMCGQICVASILGIPLEELLTQWKEKDPVFYKRIMGGNGSTTSEDLIKLLGLFGRTSSRLTIPKYTPRLFSELVRENVGVIVSVHLNTVTGALNGSGVLHWAKVLEVYPERLDMGQVLVYNPFGNAEEWYGWREFLATTRSVYGVVT